MGTLSEGALHVKVKDGRLRSGAMEARLVTDALHWLRSDKISAGDQRQNPAPQRRFTASAQMIYIWKDCLNVDSLPSS